MPSHKQARSQRDWGLPRLTVEEAARVVGVAPEVFTAWLSQMLHRKVISPSQYSKWTNDAEPISEAVIRLYLTWQGANREAAAPTKTTQQPESPRVAQRR